MSSFDQKHTRAGVSVLTDEELALATSIAAETEAKITGYVGKFYADAKALEDAGWREWLCAIAPESFTSPFSAEHIEFWDLFWSILLRLRDGEEIPEYERNIMLPFGRGNGKSTNAEAAAIAMGAILGAEFVLYLCDTQLLAEEHLASIKMILDGAPIARWYPQMGKPKVLKSGSRQKYAQDAIVCENGFAVAARGILGNVRGSRVGNRRFGLVIMDDVDSLTDSLAVIEKKKRIIAHSVFGAMSAKGLTLFVQNPITKHSVASQILNRMTDILSRRTIIGGGPIKSFTDLELGEEELETGDIVPTIIRATPRWEHFSITDAKNFLSKSGKEAFLAEYQHEFDEHKGMVVSAYDEAAQVITWSMFEREFGVRYIPQHWKAGCALDVGFSDGAHPHYSAWVFVAVAAANTRMPGAQFVYRSRFFKGTSIDDQAQAILRDVGPQASQATGYVEFAPRGLNTSDPAEIKAMEGQTFGQGIIKHWQISHEATGVQMTLWKYGFPFTKTRHSGKTDGIAQWNYLSKPNLCKPHPFKHSDKLITETEYEIGMPMLYYIVDDDQLEHPRDDNGHKLLREQIMGWEWVPTQLTRTGITTEQPSKINEDGCDALRMCLAYFKAAGIASLSAQEKRLRRLPEALQVADDKLTDDERRRKVMMLQTQDMQEKKERSTAFARDPINAPLDGAALDRYLRQQKQFPF